MQIRCALLFVGLANVAWSQTFEVASVKPRDPAATDMGSCEGGPGTKDPLHYRCVSYPVAGLAATAFGTPFQDIDAPDWTSTTLTGYDLQAVLPAGATKDDLRGMLRNLLDERFHLKWHRETREIQTYVLSASSPKLRKSDPQSPSTIRGNLKNPEQLFTITARRKSIPVLVSLLFGILLERMEDDTHLAGEYDFDLEFVSPLASAAVRGPSPFTALREQLGLELKP